MRVIWNGTLAIGRLGVPVGLAVAQKRADVHFRTLHAPCGTPVSQRQRCPACDQDVEPGETVRGWEAAPGQFVLVPDYELDQLAPDTDRTIRVEHVVPEQKVPVVFRDRTYWLTPAPDRVNRRPYWLLAQALHEEEAAAIARFTLWGRENLGLVRPDPSSVGLALDTLYLADDVREPVETRELAREHHDVDQGDLRLARRLVRAMRARAFQPHTQLTSGWRENVQQLLEAKIHGRHWAPADRPAPVAPVVDLERALRESLQDANARRRPAAHRG
ncbi:MAG: Ku protein [Thermoleophilia bacterium]